VYDHLFPQNVMFPLTTGLDNGIHFLVIGGVFPNSIGECLTMVCHRMLALSPQHSQMNQSLIQVDISGHPLFPTGSKHFYGNFGNLLFLAVFNFRGHFEGLNEGFSGSSFLMKFEGIIEPPKLISSTIPFQRPIIRLKRRSYAKVTTLGS
jgi:hypothetical protein